MPFLIDTNVFLRLVPVSDPERTVVLSALRQLRLNNEGLFYSTQVLAEFWTVCTRPATSRGGYGLSTVETERKARIIERHCNLLTENLASHQEWRRLIVSYSVQGVEVHDAKHVALMNVYGIENLLTLDKDDFKRYSGINVFAPSDI